MTTNLPPLRQRQTVFGGSVRPIAEGPKTIRNIPTPADQVFRNPFSDSKVVRDDLLVLLHTFLVRGNA